MFSKLLITNIINALLADEISRGILIAFLGDKISPEAIIQDGEIVLKDETRQAFATFFAQLSTYLAEVYPDDAREEDI